VGVTARLVALVMVPVLILAALAVSELIPRWSTASKATAIEAQVDSLEALVGLHGALAGGRYLAEFDRLITAVDVSRGDLADLLGFDVATQVGETRESAEDALRILGADAPVDVVTVRASFAALEGTPVEPAVADRFEALAITARERVVDEIEAIRDTMSPAHAHRLDAALESLRIAGGLIDVVAPQGLHLGTLWYPSSQDQLSDTQAAYAWLGALSTGHRAATTRLRQLEVPRVIASLDRIAADRSTDDFDDAVKAARDGEAIAANPDGSQINAIFRGYMVRVDMIGELVEEAIGAVGDEASDLAAAQRRAFVSWAGLALALAAVAVTTAVIFGRSIAKPLHDLAAYAQAVNAGRLDTDPGHGDRRGPRETRAAFAVVTGLATNLRLLDAKANALATCAFDDPVLSEPLPGRLGSSLDSSVTVLSDSIVERDRLQSHLAHQATHDPLTGVANRTAALIGIREAIGRSRRSGEPTAVLVVDLNAFKSINDRFGQTAGDEVLRRTAERLARRVRSVDLVARTGGDEFVVISERVSGIDAAVDLARRILAEVNRPIDVAGGSMSVDAAIGLALSTDGADDAHRLLAHADAAMVRAKHRDRSAIEVFDTDLQRRMVEREDIEHALAEAIAAPGGGGLVLHYQPVLDVATRCVVGVEALVRWIRPGHGFLPPDAFIPIAEATSLIIDLDRWVLGEAVRRLVDWSDDPELARLPIAVNISGRHVCSGHLPGFLAELLGATGIDPRRLTIEITETVLLDDLERAATELDAVRALGIHVALDDFGTGYTSLAHLQHLSIDSIKIDRSFISQLSSRRGQALVRMVTDLGHAIDRIVLAEGVETDDELTVLGGIGVDQVQGYLLARPLDLAALVEWMRQRISVTALTHLGADDHQP
jgi:diguanylate cyclase (GGDEF)-like protein